jgi:hypothetical protein
MEKAIQVIIVSLPPEIQGLAADNNFKIIYNMNVKTATDNENKPKATVKNLQFIEKLDQLIDIAEKEEESEEGSPVQGRSSGDLLTLRVGYIERYDWYDTIFEENGKYGTKDVTGKVILPAQYDGIGELCHQIYFGKLPRVAVLNGKCGLVLPDGSGKALTDFEFDSMSYMIILPYFKVKMGEKYGIIRKDGKIIVPCILDEVCLPLGHCVVFKANGKYGLIDSWCGDLYVAPEYDNIEIVDMEQPYTMTKDGVEGVINQRGEFLTLEESLDYEDYLIGEYNPDF